MNKAEFIDAVAAKAGLSKKMQKVQLMQYWILLQKL